MEIEKRIRDDFWKAIQAHYERKDYTEVVRDAIYFVCDTIRNLSGLEDKDGTKLIDSSFLGNSPAILINRYETTTEKDIQQGVGFILKGIMQSIRNPLSHEKTEYSSEQADAIILFIDYLLKQIDHTGGTTKIQDIEKLLHDRNFTASEEYADLLLKEIPKKKRYDLLIELYKDRINLPQHVLNHFIDKLIESLTKTEKSDFIRIVSTNLMMCKDDAELRMYFHYFMRNTYDEVDRLAKLRVEDFVIKSIRKGEIIDRFNPEHGQLEKDCNVEGSLATWIIRHIDLFEKKEQMVEEMFLKLKSPNKNCVDYVFNYFKTIVFDSSIELQSWQVSIIKEKLNAGDERFYNALFYIMELAEESEWSKLFRTDFDAFNSAETSKSKLPL